MVIFATGFTLGVWLLQQQPVLPDFAWAGALPGLVVLYLAAHRWDNLPVRFMRTALLYVFACGFGFFQAAWQAEQRLAVSLPDGWQGRDIVVVGVVPLLPQTVSGTTLGSVTTPAAVTGDGVVVNVTLQ